MTRVPAETLEYPGDGLHYLDDRPFTGVAFTTYKDGRPKAEMSYREGLRWGPTVERYPEGQLMVESTYYKGVLHGHAREWHRNGQMAEDGEYEYGIIVWEKMWDEGGALERDYALKPTDQDYQTLQHYRQTFGAGGAGG